MRNIFLLILIIPRLCFSQIDTTRFNKLQDQISSLSNKMDEVKRDQNNYSIEKDLLKETNSNNFERINLTITAILGIFAFFTFFGIRDLNSIKKEYREELEKMRKLQAEIEAKSKEFDISKKKYDDEITDILKQNEEQNKKIKILEIKEKISSLFAAKQYVSALEYCAVALELSPNDLLLLYEKGKILSKLARFGEAIEAYEKVLSKDPSTSSTIGNITELYYFKNQIGKGEILIKNNPEVFVDKGKFKLLDFFDLLKKYHKNDISGMKEFAKQIIDKKNPDLENSFRKDIWDFTDAITFAQGEPDSESKNVLRDILLYLNRTLKAKDLDINLDLKIFDS